MEQMYTSKDTSMNIISAVYKKIEFAPKSKVLDYGGGKYNTAKDYMAKQNVELFIFDPYNRTKDENRKTRLRFKKRKSDASVCSNVLNVIKEDNIILDILQDIKNLTNPKGNVYILIYQGNQTGVGKETTKGYQRNMKAKYYFPFISEVFKGANIRLVKNMFIISEIK